MNWGKFEQRIAKLQASIRSYPQKGYGEEMAMTAYITSMRDLNELETIMKILSHEDHAENHGKLTKVRDYLLSYQEALEALLGDEIVLPVDKHEDPNSQRPPQ